MEYLVLPNARLRRGRLVNTDCKYLQLMILSTRKANHNSRATQFGTTWYHSHWSAQYGDGVVGTMIIDGPASSNYDEDLGTLPLTDWYYKTAFELNEVAQHSRTGPPTPDNFLVNGTHISGAGVGKYAKMTVVKVRRHSVATSASTNSAYRTRSIAFGLSTPRSTTTSQSPSMVIHSRSSRLISSQSSRMSPIKSQWQSANDMM